MTRYVDPNSGAAPQPGGWAGAEGAALGHALPGFETEVEQKRQLTEGDDVATPRTVQEIVDREFASSDAAPEANEEQEAVNQASLEHSAVDPSEEPEKEEKAEKPAKKATAKKTAKK